ncbi:hypothetical protein HZS_7300 [Henneguya salminicola]|nr:hypothetical protein HZS_7300 [Henneguya salminicola]
MFKDIAYIIPSKSSVYFKIREIRNILNLDSIQIVQKPPLRDKRNESTISKKILGRGNTWRTSHGMIWATNESLCMMR